MVVTRIRTATRSKYTNDHAQHLNELEARWGSQLVRPYIEDGTGVNESLTMGVPVYDRSKTQNVGGRGLDRQYQELVDALKARIDSL